MFFFFISTSNRLFVWEKGLIFFADSYIFCDILAKIVP